MYSMAILSRCAAFHWEAADLSIWRVVVHNLRTEMCRKFRFGKAVAMSPNLGAAAIGGCHDVAGLLCKDQQISFQTE